jgi:hypothetical protein
MLAPEDAATNGVGGHMTETNTTDLGGKPDASTRLPTVRQVGIAASLLGVVALIIIQVSTASHATALEVALFNVLQFIFSLIFAWLLSHAVSEDQFRERQKRFAMACFRRVKEIERSLLRLQDYVMITRSAGREELSEAISVIRIGLEGAQDNVRSSIADWGDVIGSALEVANEVSRLQALRQPDAKDSSGRIIDRLSEHMEEVNKKIAALTPKSAAVVPASPLSPANKRDMPFKEAFGKIRAALGRTGSYTCAVYWDSEDSFPISPAMLKPGDRLTLARGITNLRSDCVLAYDSQNKKLGVVLNWLGDEHCDYETFLRAFTKVLGKSLLLDEGTEISAIVKEVEPRRSVKTKKGVEVPYQHFSVEIRREPDSKPASIADIH